MGSKLLEQQWTPNGVALAVGLLEPCRVGM